MTRALLLTWRMMRTRARIRIKPKTWTMKQSIPTSGVGQIALSLHDLARNLAGTSRKPSRPYGLLFNPAQPGTLRIATSLLRMRPS
jgi:hypothetical protein